MEYKMEEKLEGTAVGNVVRYVVSSVYFIFISAAKYEFFSIHYGSLVHPIIKNY